MAIPFVREFDFTYGEAQHVSPLITRVIANNPGSFTYTGTGVYIIGRKDIVAIIDPGPKMESHFSALKAALAGKTVSHVFVTHSHSDHSPLAHPLANWAQCQVYAGGPVIPSDGAVRMEAGDDLNFRPDILLSDGHVFKGPDWTIEAIASPGHTSNHFCFALSEENALFSGDHVMGWSTTVISPPDGNMRDYLDSLAKVRDRDFDTIWPTHGPPVHEKANARPRDFIQAYIDHRMKREAAIINRLKAGDTTISQMVKTIYADVDKKLHPAACHSVLGQIIKLVEDGRVKTNLSPPTVSAQYELV